VTRFERANPKTPLDIIVSSSKSTSRNIGKHQWTVALLVALNRWNTAKRFVPRSMFPFVPVDSVSPIKPIALNLRSIAPRCHHFRRCPPFKIALRGAVAKCRYNGKHPSSQPPHLVERGSHATNSGLLNAAKRKFGQNAQKPEHFWMLEIRKRGSWKGGAAFTGSAS
jgi:hypothetical protein